MADRYTHAIKVRNADATARLAVLNEKEGRKLWKKMTKAEVAATYKSARPGPGLCFLGRRELD